MGRKKNDGGRDPNLSGRDPNLSGSQMIFFTFWMLVFFGGTFFGIVVFGFVLADAVDDARADLDARDWDPVNGTIIASGVDKYFESDGEGGSKATYCLRIEYEYGYENETYNGDMISHSLRSSSYDAASCDSNPNADDDYPPGEPITVYVDPNDPNRAVLLTGWSGLDIGWEALILIPVGIIICLVWARILLTLTRGYLDSVMALIRRGTG